MPAAIPSARRLPDRGRMFVVERALEMPVGEAFVLRVTIWIPEPESATWMVLVTATSETRCTACAKFKPWHWPNRKICTSGGCGGYPMHFRQNGERFRCICMCIRAPWRTQVLPELASRGKRCSSAGIRNFLGQVSKP